MRMSVSSTVHSDDLPTIEQLIDMGLRDQRELEEELGETRRGLRRTILALVRKLNVFSLQRSASYQHSWRALIPKVVSSIAVLALLRSVFVAVRHRNHHHQSS